MEPGATAARRLARPRRGVTDGHQRVPAAACSHGTRAFRTGSEQFAPAPQTPGVLELLTGPLQLGGPARACRGCPGVRLVVRQQRPARRDDAAERARALER